MKKWIRSWICFSAFESILEVISKDCLILLESTVPIGTTHRLYDLLNNSIPSSINVELAYCPERVMPGNILQELVANDRIVGGVNNGSTISALAFYKQFVLGNVYSTNAKTAEMVKLAENSYRDLNIAFANELSIICDQNKIDVWELIKLANYHPRVDILNPGAGVGGHCIAVDPWFDTSKF